MLVLLAAQASVSPAPRFAPALDRPYRIVLHQEREQAGVIHRYEQERRLVFHRDAAGLIAELTLVRVSQDIGGAAGQRFEAAAGALKGRMLRFHLSAEGGLQSIDDEAGAWAATLAGIRAAAAAPTAPAGALTRDPAAPMATFLPERRRAALAGPLAALIVAAPPLGIEPVTLASGVVPGASLSGTRSVTTDADTHLHVHVHAQAADGAVTLDREQMLDPATGLLLDEREVQTIGRGDAAQIIRQYLTVTPLVS